MTYLHSPEMLYGLIFILLTFSFQCQYYAYNIYVKWTCMQVLPGILYLVSNTHTFIHINICTYTRNKIYVQF